jgi:hypothetical protein
MNYGGSEVVDLSWGVILMQSENNIPLCGGWSLEIYRPSSLQKLLCLTRQRWC